MPQWKRDRYGTWRVEPDNEREELLARMDELFLGAIGVWILLGVTVATLYMMALLESGGLP